MKIFYAWLTAGALLTGFLLPSCASETPWDSPADKGTGYLHLSLNSNSKLDMGVQVATRATQTAINVPSADVFQVRLENTDGSFRQTWSTVDEFNKGAEVPVGVYTLTAFYGDPNAQGHCGESGFDNAYFEGVAENIHVTDKNRTPVELTVALKNCAVQVEYGESFKKYFHDWSTTLSSNGHEALRLGKSEDIHFLTPSDNVDVSIGVTYQNGKTTTLQPTSFQAEARHLHRIKYDIANGEVGEVNLSITFPDNVDEVHDIVVDISDLLDYVDGPIVSTMGVVNGMPVDVALGMGAESSLVFNVTAKAKISKAILNVISNNYEPSWLTNSVIDLCQADASKLNAMKDDGFVALGFDTEGTTSGQLDIKEACKNLPEGQHKFMLTVTDGKGQVSDPVTITVNVASPSSNIGGITAANYGDGMVQLAIEYTGPDLTQPGMNPFTFACLKDGYGNYTERQTATMIQSATQLATRAFPTDTYYFTIPYPTMKDRDNVSVKVFCYEKMIGEVTAPYTFVDDVSLQPTPSSVKIVIPNGRGKEYDGRIQFSIDGEIKRPLCQADGSFIIAGLSPDHQYTLNYWFNVEGEAQIHSKTFETKDSPYTVELDPMATKLRVRLTGTTDNMNCYIDDNKVELGTPVGGIYTINDLTPGTTHTFSTKYMVNGEEQYSTSDSFTLEAATDVPDIHVTATEPEINITGVPIGGEYRVSPANYHLQSSIVRHVPIGWATLNSLTCYTNSSNKNTWFMVPSTYIDGEVVKVITVGYNHNGITPDRSGGAFNTNYYCENAPSDAQLNKAAGELFLGSYSYNGSESRTDGVDFASRPEAMTFRYTYNPQNNEQGSVYIRVFDASGNVISEKSEIIETSVTESELTLTLPDYDFGVKAAKLELCFKSSTASNPTIHIPSGSELDEGQGLGSHTLNANSYHAKATGSELTLYSVKLIY